ncbi:MAG: lysozyme inhibitor LprI family protein [Pseudomonadales bacterium]
MNKYLFLLIWLYSTAILSDDFDCDKAMTTIEINHCAGLVLESAENEMSIYLLKSKAHHHYDPELIKSIEAAQKTWSAYAQAHCDSIYTMWREGSIRGVMYLSCKTNITKQRTHDIWFNFLTYMDSTPPVLPEPEVM